MEKITPSRRFLFVFDDLDATTIDKNVGLFAQFLAEQGIGVDIITAELSKNANIKFSQKNIKIIRIPAGNIWPQLQSNSFRNYLNHNVHKYFCIWVYRGRPYAEYVVDVSVKNNVLTLVKLDSDVSFSKFGKFFFNVCKKINVDEKKLYNNIFFLLKTLSIIPSVKGFLLYDSIIFRCSLVLCESKLAYKTIKKVIHSAPVFYFPNAVPVKKYSIYTERFKKARYKKKNLIISVGRITPVKEYEKAIIAFSKLSSNIQKNWSYEIIGPVVNKQYNKILIKLIKKLNLEKKVKLVGGLYGLDLFLKYFQSSILLMPYKAAVNGVEMEGQPNVIPQGMFFRNVPIATSLSGTRHFINKSSGEGVLLPDNNPVTIQTSLENLINSVNTLAAIQENANKKITKEFNLDTVAEKIWKTIIDLDYDTYLHDQKSDTLALEPEVIKNAVFKYLDFLTKKIITVNYSKAKILDIGCREFYSYDYFKNKFNNIIQGIEIGPEALSFAKKKNITEIDIHKMSLAFKKNYFDIVLSFHVLEHMYDLPLALKNCQTVLKKGGILFFAIPMPSHDTRRSHWLEIANQNEMVKLLNRSGFKSVFYKTYPADVFRNEPEMIGIFKKL